MARIGLLGRRDDPQGSLLRRVDLLIGPDAMPAKFWGAPTVKMSDGATGGQFVGPKLAVAWAGTGAPDAALLALLRVDAAVLLLVVPAGTTLGDDVASRIEARRANGDVVQVAQIGSYTELFRLSLEHGIEHLIKPARPHAPASSHASAPAKPGRRVPVRRG